MNLVAIHNFWRGIQWAFNYVPAIGVADRPEMTDGLIDRLLVGNHTWLTAKVADTTEFFSENETSFQFLPKAEFDSLANAVKALWSVAVELRPHGLASEDQRKRALPHFKAIIKLLGFDRYEDPDAFVIGKGIENAVGSLGLSQLSQLRFMTGLDNTGTAALWIWAYLTAEASNTDDQVKRSAGLLRPILREVARDVAPERYPYVSFRSVSDPVVEGAAA